MNQIIANNNRTTSISNGSGRNQPYVKRVLHENGLYILAGSPNPPGNINNISSVGTPRSLMAGAVRGKPFTSTPLLLWRAQPRRNSTNITTSLSPSAALFYTTNSSINNLFFGNASLGRMKSSIIVPSALSRIKGFHLSTFIIHHTRQPTSIQQQLCTSSSYRLRVTMFFLCMS